MLYKLLTLSVITVTISVQKEKTGLPLILRKTMINDYEVSSEFDISLFNVLRRKGAVWMQMKMFVFYTACCLMVFGFKLHHTCRRLPCPPAGNTVPR